MIIRDSLNRPFNINSRPQRIISLVPSQTELLVDLGLEKEIVGITKFCVHPQYLKSTKTIVGGTKQVHLDKIKKLQPDIIFCNKEENTKTMVKALQDIAHVHVSDIKTLEDNVRLINDYGKILKVESKAEALAEKLQIQQNQFQQFINDKDIKKVGYLIWREPWMAVGSDTFIDHILSLNHFENVFAYQSRYPEIDISNLSELDFLFLSSEPYPFKTKHFDDIPIDNSKIKLVNGEFFSWYGSRMLMAFDYFLNDLHN